MENRFVAVRGWGQAWSRGGWEGSMCSFRKSTWDIFPVMKIFCILAISVSVSCLWFCNSLSWYSHWENLIKGTGDISVLFIISEYVCVWCVCVNRPVMSNSATPCTVACQAPLSLKFSRQEYWIRLPFPIPGGIFLNQGSNPGLLHCRRILYHLSHQGSPKSEYEPIIISKQRL